MTRVAKGLTTRTVRLTLPSMPRHTALIVPVPEADAYVVDAPPGIRAHITVLSWFLDPEAVDEEALVDLFAPVPAFEFALDRLEHWPEGITWLHPEPSQPFVELTEAVWRSWPECPPYGGVHAEIIPHLTLAKTAIEPVVPLPIRCRATAVALVEEDDAGVFALRRSFALG